MPTFNGSFTGRGQSISTTGLYVAEKADADADVSGSGQLWVDNQTPCELYFTTDAGDDIQITTGTSLGTPAGSISLANGTNNYVTTASSASALNGEANLTFDGSQLTVTGDVSVSANIEAAGYTQANLVVKADNETGATLTKGTAVYVSATHASGRPSVAEADANGAGTYPSIGLVWADIADTAQGFITQFGVVEDIAAARFVGTDPSVGDTVYMSETAGKLTVDRPTAVATQVQNIGRITKTNVNIGGNTGSANVLVQGPGRTNDTPNSSTAVFLSEQAAAVPDTAGYGQLWVKNATPTELYFTTDAGDDIQLTTGTVAAGGGAAANDENLILHMAVFT